MNDINTIIIYGEDDVYKVNFKNNKFSWLMKSNYLFDMQ
jgi:hypothetical protein